MWGGVLLYFVRFYFRHSELRRRLPYLIVGSWSFEYLQTYLYDVQVGVMMPLSFSHCQRVAFVWLFAFSSFLRGAAWAFL